jgi:hypothetical protein
MTPAKVHACVAVLFALAIGCYLLAWTSIGAALGALGFLFEIIAWIAWCMPHSKAKTQPSDGRSDP